MRDLHEVDELGLSAAGRAAAERVFGDAVPPSRPPAARPPWTALAIVTLALAVAFHAAAVRYETVTDGAVTTRLDRLTGRLVRCFGPTDLCHAQAILPAPGMGALPTR